MEYYQILESADGLSRMTRIPPQNAEYEIRTALTPDTTTFSGETFQGVARNYRVYTHCGQKLDGDVCKYFYREVLEQRIPCDVIPIRAQTQIPAAQLMRKDDYTERLFHAKKQLLGSLLYNCMDYASYLVEEDSSDCDRVVCTLYVAAKSNPERKAMQTLQEEAAALRQKNELLNNTVSCLSREVESLRRERDSHIKAYANMMMIYGNMNGGNG